MRVLAQLVGEELERQDGCAEQRRLQRARILDLIPGSLDMVFQPIGDLTTRQPAGFEALARFTTDPECSPEQLFREAWEAGVGVELEVAAARMAVSRLQEASPACYLSINVSPATVLSGGFEDVLAGIPSARLVLEITEHAQIDDYESLHSALAPLRARGVRLAIDDAGAGFASLRHILRLSPDIIKLDSSLIRNISGDQARLALTEALISFGALIGAATIAEGVETENEAGTLRALGVDFAQGHLIGSPEPLTDAECLIGG